MRKKSPNTLIFPSGSSDSPTPTSARSARVIRKYGQFKFQNLPTYTSTHPCTTTRALRVLVGVRLSLDPEGKISVLGDFLRVR